MKFQSDGLTESSTLLSVVTSTEGPASGSQDENEKASLLGTNSKCHDPGHSEGKESE